MLAAILRIFLGFAGRHHFLLRFFLILNEFDVRHLRARRRWNQEEESKDEGGNHCAEVEDIGAAAASVICITYSG